MQLGRFRSWNPGCNRAACSANCRRPVDRHCSRIVLKSCSQVSSHASAVPCRSHAMAKFVRTGCTQAAVKVTLVSCRERTAWSPAVGGGCSPACRRCLGFSCCLCRPCWWRLHASAHHGTPSSVPPSTLLERSDSPRCGALFLPLRSGTQAQRPTAATSWGPSSPL